MTEILSELIEFLREVSPSVWQTLVRQVYIEAIAYIVIAVILVILCIICVKVLKRNWSNTDTYSIFQDETIVAVLFVVTSFGGVAILVLLVSAGMKLANPEFYAIQYILSQLVGK